MYEIDKKTGEPARNARGELKLKTSHTLNPVPLHVFAPGQPIELDPKLSHPGLANLASTVLYLMGFESPEDYLPSLVRARA
jgi:2,3-bisphosphoglycerate-independent phosphoglycerate mutase